MKRFWNPALIFIVGLSILLGWARLTTGHDCGDDFASYIMQAKSILDGNVQEFFVPEQRVTILKTHRMKDYL